MLYIAACFFLTDKPENGGYIMPRETYKVTVDRPDWMRPEFLELSIQEEITNIGSGILTPVHVIRIKEVAHD